MMEQLTGSAASGNEDVGVREGISKCLSFVRCGFHIHFVFLYVEIEAPTMILPVKNTSIVASRISCSNSRGRWCLPKLELGKIYT